ncbi:5-bromo-4-chloroindolyl phosphate hydrolysis family protein [uncultured Cardiobacterium sp.]|uniref:5-bromo-4-chloroindolyl phosphate hydrolysis family protein n=1 Tax=uncultured Cardiobacterium sp. TaxID=417619 RepID=UPI002605BC3D|nr:5-bromo-4-chloroindolyl phosphate hydrolysis family protein [uncultured Cardiobacterium sp.]
MPRDHKAIVKQQYLGIRGMALYLVQIPLWLLIPLNLILFRPLPILSAGIAAALLCYAAYLTQQHYRSRRDNYIKTGQEHADEDNRPYALGFTALAAAVLAFTARPQPLFALLNALVAAAGYYLSYLYDDTPAADVRPPRDIPAALNDTLRKMLADGYDAVEQLEHYTKRLQLLAEERGIAGKLGNITARARAIIKHIGSDAERIRAARSFLIVHLGELKNISAQYLADIGNPGHDAQQTRFLTLLDDSEQAFTAQHLQLTSQEQIRLDTQMQVLREQLNPSQTHDPH